MKTFSRRIWVTCDGVEHRSEEYAAKHVEEAYGNRVLLLAQRITACNGKYSEIVNMVESSTQLLRDLITWKDDKRLVEDIDERDESNE